MAAAVQRKAIEADCQRFTFRLTWRTVPIIFSMMLVQASDRRSSVGRPRRLTVRISSNPSRMLLETPGASCSRRRARLRMRRPFAPGERTKSDCVRPGPSFRPDLRALLAVARSGGQGWPLFAATASAARSVLDGREHGGTIEPVGAGDLSITACENTR